MDNIVECAYNMDNGYVEVWFIDGNMLRIKCEEVEAALRTTEQSLAKLHKLLDEKPIEYVAMALSGEMQAYCDIEDDMVKGMFGTIVQGYLKKGYRGPDPLLSIITLAIIIKVSPYTFTLSNIAFMTTYIFIP